MEAKTRRLFIRGAIAVLWIALGVILFVMNRGHSLLLDNKSVEELSLEAPELVTVTVDKGKSIEFFRGDRDIVKVGGGKHRLTVEFTGGTPSFTKTFSLPLKGDMYLLSIPKMLAGMEPFYEPFVNTAPQSRDEEEEPNVEI